MLSENCILKQVFYKVSLAEINKRINDQFDKLYVKLSQKLYFYPHFPIFDL